MDGKHRLTAHNPFSQDSPLTPEEFAAKQRAQSRRYAQETERLVREMGERDAARVAEQARFDEE